MCNPHWIVSTGKGLEMLEQLLLFSLKYVNLVILQFSEQPLRNSSNNFVFWIWLNSMLPIQMENTFLFNNLKYLVPFLHKLHIMLTFYLLRRKNQSHLLLHFTFSFYSRVVRIHLIFFLSF